MQKQMRVFMIKLKSSIVDKASNVVNFYLSFSEMAYQYSL